MTDGIAQRRRGGRGRYQTVACIGLLALAASFGTVSPAAAQETTNYRFEWTSFNMGGHPAQGVTLATGRYSLQFDTLGDEISPLDVTTTSYRTILGLAGTYPPPGEVINVRFQDRTLLLWDGEPSAGTYNIYSGPLTELQGMTYGACLQAGTTEPNHDIRTDPAMGEADFFLVTVRNGLYLEGTKGYDSSMVERENNAPCP